MKYKNILLDWDGCAADTLSLWMNAYRTVYASYGLNPTPSEITARSWGNLAKGPAAMGVADPDGCWKQIVDTVERNVPKVRLHDGLVQFLSAAKSEGCAVAVVTSSERRLVEPAVEAYGLSGYFDAVVTEKEVSRPKPDPEMLYLALGKIGGTTANALIIGDTNKDIEAGKSAGVATALMLHPGNAAYYDFAKLKTTNPTYTCSSFDELRNTIAVTS